MHRSIIAVFASLFMAASAFADLVVTTPNPSTFVTSGATLPITWTFSGSYPPTISVELVDNSKQLFTGPLALFSNLVTTSGAAAWTVPKLGFTGNNFSIILVANIGGNAVILAEGPSFAIKAEGTAPPAATSAAVGSSGLGANGSNWLDSKTKVVVMGMALAVCMVFLNL